MQGRIFEKLNIIKDGIHRIPMWMDHEKLIMVHERYVSESTQ